MTEGPVRDHGQNNDKLLSLLYGFDGGGMMTMSGNTDNQVANANSKNSTGKSIKYKAVQRFPLAS